MRLRSRARELLAPLPQQLPLQLHLRCCSYGGPPHLDLAQVQVAGQARQLDVDILAFLSCAVHVVMLSSVLLLIVAQTDPARCRSRSR